MYIRTKLIMMELTQEKSLFLSVINAHPSFSLSLSLSLSLSRAHTHAHTHTVHIYRLEALQRDLSLWLRSESNITWNGTKDWSARLWDYWSSVSYLAIPVFLPHLSFPESNLVHAPEVYRVCNRRNWCFFRNSANCA